MVRQTPNHGWDVQEADDENYTEIFDDLIDDIDDSVAQKGPIAERPSAARKGRLYISTDESPGPILYYDDGSSWGGIKGALNVPDNVTHVDANESISGSWSFSQAIDADIDGNAATADNAGEADEAVNAANLGGVPPEDYARLDSNETIDGSYTFNSSITLSGGFSSDGGTIDLPVYSGSDPSGPPQGAMWFRSDDQPTS